MAFHSESYKGPSAEQWPHACSAGGPAGRFRLFDAGLPVGSRHAAETRSVGHIDPLGDGHQHYARRRKLGEARLVGDSANFLPVRITQRIGVHGTDDLRPANSGPLEGDYNYGNCLRKQWIGWNKKETLTDTGQRWREGSINEDGRRGISRAIDIEAAVVRFIPTGRYFKLLGVALSSCVAIVNRRELCHHSYWSVELHYDMRVRCARFPGWTGARG